VSLNSSALYLGQAFGAFVGGILISSEGTGNLSIVGAVLLGVAIIVSQIALNMATRRTLAAGI
jgi:predicted MFS family arabinose efflux permease